MLDLEQIRQIKNLEILIDLLRERVGSPVSVNNLSEDLQVDNKTVERWLRILENLFIIFSISPYSQKITRALKKMRKFYFFDNGQVAGEEAMRLENLVACAILREVDWCRQVEGRKLKLHYVRDKDGREIDFAVVEGNKVILLVEAKWSDEQPAKAFLKFQHLAPLSAVQVVGADCKGREVGKGLRIENAARWLHTLSL